MSSLCGAQGIMLGRANRVRTCRIRKPTRPWHDGLPVGLFQVGTQVPCPGVAPAASLGVIIGPVARVTSMLPPPASHEWLCGQFLTARKTRPFGPVSYNRPAPGQRFLNSEWHDGDRWLSWRIRRASLSEDAACIPASGRTWTNTTPSNSQTNPGPQPNIGTAAPTRRHRWDFADVDVSSDCRATAGREVMRVPASYDVVREQLRCRSSPS